LGDVSPSYFSLDPAEDIYVAGVGGVGKILYILDDYKNDFSPEEISKIVINAAYMVYNLNKMRKDNLESSFLKCVETNYLRILQLEQDVINLCCYPKIKFLPLKNMMCIYVYDLYHTDDDFNNDKTFSALELREAMENPILLHYSGHKKPWKEDCTKAEEWFRYVMKTPFSEQFRFKSPSSRHVIGSEGVEDSLDNASTQTNGSSTQRAAQVAGKNANILAKIRRWIQAPRSA
jgi:lipopolysaccharide biosynthesis glycosyltransferase